MNLISILTVISMRVVVLVIGQSISRLCCSEEAIKCVVIVLVSVGRTALLRLHSIIQ